MLDLSQPRRIHVLGIGGSGMSAIATVLSSMGHIVSGSDSRSSPVIDRLRAQGLEVTSGHDATNVADVDVVAMSTAVPLDNPEVVAAESRGIPVLRRAQVLAAICATRPTIAVAGTHGKTTTTALLAMALREGGVGSSFIVGGEIRGFGSGGAWGHEGWFAVEADESDGTFLELAPRAVVVTNVEPDHLDHYGSFTALRNAFATFLGGAPGPRVVCIDDPVAGELAGELGEEKPCLTYGVAESADYRMVDVELSRSGVSFTLEYRSTLEYHSRDARGSSDAGARTIGRFGVPLPGLHNARNAAGAAVGALALGASVESITRSFARFPGVARRFETRGEAAGIGFVDDYAHLPSEVAAALATARSGGWRRIVCVFQPHRYTRTAALWNDFAPVFVDADEVIVTEIYAAGQQPMPGVSGRLIADAAASWVRQRGFGPEVVWIADRDDLRRHLVSQLRDGDLCLTLGAGDLTTLPDVLIEDIERAHDVGRVHDTAIETA